ncbi:GNAT family N-acetyltransferase [Paenibacillus segetis]|nr:GNAT family N-acetyltransferase [Paenibacillus segetis]
MPLLGELYNAVTSRENAVFWWVGDQDNWVNVYCASENGKMVAKGQVSIINIVPPGRSTDSKHSIYVNLKTIPEREYDFILMEQVYQYLYSRALHLKESLSKDYETILCVGNNLSEIANNQYFNNEKGFQHLNSLYTMERNLSDLIPTLQLSEDLHLMNWKMQTPSEEQEYLELDAEIWPDTPLGFERLSEYKGNPLWTAIVVREVTSSTIVGSLMVWQEEDNGVIEDVFVREPWRHRGVAKYMLITALNYLKDHEQQSVRLMALTTNDSALSLYESVGFVRVKEEIRYFTELR